MVEIKTLNDGDVVYAKGVHDRHAFARAVCERDYLDADPDVVGPPLTADIERVAAKVEYETWRFVPSANWSDYDYMSFPAERGTRGAFDVTVVYW